ncbi:MAG: ysdC [Prosthecobacter sp.]|nr:ysdC [Prosthecobacter sp.]
MLASHCDQIGFLVKYISADGFIYVDPLGGADLGVILGENLIIHNRRGAVAGIFGRKPFQFQMGSQSGQIPSNNKTWVDIGAKSREEAAEAVDIGDYATYPLQITELRNSLIASPGLDNKTGLYVSLEVPRRLAGTDLSFGLYVVSSTQEEIGSRGATVAGERLRPDIGIAVDTVPATDDPGLDLPSQTHIACTLGRGRTLSMGLNTKPAVVSTSPTQPGSTPSSTRWTLPARRPLTIPRRSRPQG